MNWLRGHEETCRYSVTWWWYRTKDWELDHPRPPHSIPSHPSTVRYPTCSFSTLCIVYDASTKFHTYSVRIRPNGHVTMSCGVDAVTFKSRGYYLPSRYYCLRSFDFARFYDHKHYKRSLQPPCGRYGKGNGIMN